MRQSLVTTAAAAAVFFAGGAWTPHQGWLAALLSAAQLVPLLWSRRAPAVVLVVVTLATAGHLLLDQPRNTMYVPVLLALYSTPRRWLAAAAALVVGGAVFPAKGPLDGTVLAVTICAVAWLLGAERRRALADRAERAARRLHDTLAQTTAVMLVQAETLRAVGDLTDADRERLDTLLAAGRGALDAGPPHARRPAGRLRTRPGPRGGAGPAAHRGARPRPRPACCPPCRVRCGSWPSGSSRRRR